MADDFTIEAFTLLAIGLCFILLRTYARLSKTGMTGFKLDDYLMLVAAAVYTAETVLAYTVGAYWHGLANNGMTDAERLALDPNSEEFRMRVNGSKTQVAGWSSYTLLLWLLKASMCSFYLRLTEGLEYRNKIYVGFGLIASTWIAVLFSILLGCHPMHKNWQIYPDPGNACQPAISRIDIFVTVVLNVLTDLYLMSIPLPMLWAANLRPVKKIGLMLLFSGGIFVTMAGILRCVLIITNPITGAQQAGSWACRETFVAVVTSNAPMIFPLMKRWGGPLFSTMRSGLSSRSRSKRSGGTGGSRSATGMIILEDKNPRRGQGPISVNPIPNMTFSESEEAINEQQLQQQLQVQKQAQAQAERDAQSTSHYHHNKNGASFDTRANLGDIEHQSGITKKVEMHVTEEERRRRSGGSNGSDSIDIMEAIQGAHRGNYFLTQQNDQPRRNIANGSAGAGSINEHSSSLPSTTAASPLAMHAWDGHTSSASGAIDSKHGTMGLTGSRR
ncbi:short-chain dehydrogenase reductase sdr [Ophiostoma piceae UAMH 11346]|uniref:Short-chain dehydrogenase reductase sdr n=1 Tax=Ophiostoma piceae (strain UAMH 11346) TaxID=1262450 RepID=S3CAI3_OPHP1|nr:short-chain dehydrogenase reductase sdr [Ophiostoma piceae UAMH 11346]